MFTEGIKPSVLVDDGTEISTMGILALFLGGAEDSFTGHLLRLMQKADPGNKARLRAAFPRTWAAYDMWMGCPQAPTVGQLTAMLGGVPPGKGPDYIGTVDDAHGRRVKVFHDQGGVKLDLGLSDLIFTRADAGTLTDFIASADITAGLWQAAKALEDM